MSTSRKIVFFILLVCLLLTWAQIWRFSMASHGESAAQSGRVAAFLASVFSVPEEKMPAFHTFVRKMAHFTEYAVLGFEAFCLLVCGDVAMRRRSHRLLYMSPLAFCTAVAAADETIQYFTARGNSVTDVLLDAVGAFCGCVTAYACVALITRIRNRKEK